MAGLQEFIIIILIIIILSMTGLWPQVIRGLRELRGEYVPDPPPRGNKQDVEVCYRLFGLSPSAKWDEVERAYRAKAKIHHPDRGGDEDAMRALNEAYNYLKQVKKPK